MSAHAETSNRREFLKASAAVAASGLVVPQFVHAAGSDVLKVGLIGCGGRGTGAAGQALRADANVKLWAMADAFADHLEKSLGELQKEEDIAGKLDVATERRFAGFDAYKQLLASGVDVVLLATPPHFRPIHLKAAIDAGKHVFAEKPVAVDGPGVRSVLKTCAEAKEKGLSVVSGLCLRHSEGFSETIRRVHEGQIGEVVALQANDYRGPIWEKERKPEWSDMEWQMRNWYYYTWLSGDFNVEQHVHMLDVCARVMKDEYPVRATGTGGRQVRTGKQFGNIYDHFAVTYEYASGLKLFATCRQMAGCSNDISAHVLGSKGEAIMTTRKFEIQPGKGGTAWVRTEKDNNYFQTEHDVLFASIRSGKPVNNGDYMSKTTLMAVMGRMSAYTGKTVTWEQAMDSSEDLSPPKYEWGPLAEPAIAMPGVTRLV